MKRTGKFTPVKLAEVLTGLRMGMPQHQAAAAAGIQPATLSRWIHEEEGIAELVMEAEASFVEKHVRNLDDIAMAGGKQSASVSQWMLERRDPATWGRATRNDLYTRDQQVRELVEELRREGLDVSVDQVKKELGQVERKALPGGKS